MDSPIVEVVEEVIETDQVTIHEDYKDDDDNDQMIKSLENLDRVETTESGVDAASMLLSDLVGHPSNEQVNLNQSLSAIHHPQSFGYFYAIRGNQVFKIDKATGTASPIRTSTSSEIKLQVVDGQKSSDSTQISEDSKSFIYKEMSGESIVPPQGFKPVSSSAFQTSTYARDRPFGTSKVATKRRYQHHQLLGHRKPCNCNKSQCLKLYCDCFANGEFCQDCNCKECHNNMDFESERSKAIRASLDRNPNAFRPKIGKGRSDVERLHQKGCMCRKSNCLKNYCECYEAKVPCTERCKCNSCRNTETDRQNKVREKFSSSSGLLHLAAAAAADVRVGSPFSEEDSDGDHDQSKNPKRMPWFYMTDEVVEAATLCLVAQAEDQESGGNSLEIDMEKAILREFGSCLQQIIENAANISQN